jgi:GNAT superfamily N-acetyltransferase
VTPYRITVQDDLDPEDVEVVFQGLRAFNAGHAGPSDRKRLAVFLRGPDGRVAGGLVGETAWRWLYVDAFWIDEALRGQGHGRAMLGAAEERARARGCANAYLDTFDFQALPFYRKEGYELFGTLEGFPPGHRRYFLKKAL